MIRPRPGDVIRYGYLWHREAQTGQEEGLKDRPCAVVLGPTDDGRTAVLPITHREPDAADEAVPLPLGTKRRLGLDAAPAWVVLTEVNLFTWPGPDVRPLPGQGLDTAIYGALPGKLFREIRDRFVERWRNRRASSVRRSE
jgi:hypothetical protein